MSPESVDRVCEVCSSEIPKWKAKGTTVCSVACRFKRKEQKRLEANEKRKSEGRSIEESVQATVLHNCLSSALDPPRNCRCRQRITDDEAKRFVSEGEAVNFATRLPVFTPGEAVLVVGRKLRTSRSSTVERPHIERLVEKPKQLSKKKERSIAELEAAVAADRAAKFEEEQLRLHIWGEMRHEFYDALIVQIPAADFDAKERESWGRPGIFHVEEERTSVGENVLYVSGECSIAAAAAKGSEK